MREKVGAASLSNKELNTEQEGFRKRKVEEPN